MTTPPCPSWCTETHDPETEERFGDADHIGSHLFDLGGACVALWRLDVDGVAGPVRVYADLGPDHWLSPEHAARLADALTVALIEAARNARSAA